MAALLLCLVMAGCGAAVLPPEGGGGQADLEAGEGGEPQPGEADPWAREPQREDLPEDDGTPPLSVTAPAGWQIVEQDGGLWIYSLEDPVGGMILIEPDDEGVSGNWSEEDIEAFSTTLRQMGSFADVRFYELSTAQGFPAAVVTSRYRSHGADMVSAFCMVETQAGAGYLFSFTLSGAYADVEMVTETVQSFWVG